MTFYSTYFLTPYGPGIVSASAHGITGVEMPDVSRSVTVSHEVLHESVSSEITAHAALMLQRYFHGECIDFSALPVDLRDLPPFRQHVLNVIRKLAFGEIRSYGQVAEMCGSPRSARAVGGALASNPVPLIIPCHRVVATNGRMTGFSAPGGINSKKVLLQLEGVEFKGLQVVADQLVMHRTAGR